MRKPMKRRCFSSWFLSAVALGRRPLPGSADARREMYYDPRRMNTSTILASFRRGSGVGCLAGRRFLGLLAGAGVLLCLGSACASDPKSTCAGVEIDGACQAKCVDTACEPGYRCTSDNACSKPCIEQADCPIGRNCVRYGFGDGTEATLCFALPYTQGGRTGQNEACAASTECDEMRGFKCLGGTCRLGQGDACTADTECDVEAGFGCSAGLCRGRCGEHADCAEFGGHCESTGKFDQLGASINLCVDDTEPHAPGQFGTRCPNVVSVPRKTCGQDGGEPPDPAAPQCECESDTDCAPRGGASQCNPEDAADPTTRHCVECDERAGFLCQGAGPGDYEAYCTKDCKSDGDCVTGYFCGDVHSQTTDTPPKPLHYQRCLKKSFCNECETDGDCLGIPSQICAKDIGGAKICTVLCDPGALSCAWGNAGICDVWDTERNVPTCAHRFESCNAKGVGCGPCVRDADCGAKGQCLVSTFGTKEHYCLNVDDSCSCTSSTDGSTCVGGGCPDSPGGLAMTCYGGPDQAGSGAYQKCIGANANPSIGGTPQQGCWPPL